MQGKSKRKVAEHWETTSDKEEPLNVTFTSSDEEDERYRASKKPTLEPIPKRHQSEARSKAIHDPLLRTSQMI